MGLKVTLSVAEDEQLRQTVRELIAGEVRGILRAELGGIVHAELAKLRLASPNSPALHERIEKHVQTAIKNQINVTAMMRHIIEQEVRKSISEIDVKPRLLEGIKRAFGL